MPRFLLPADLKRPTPGPSVQRAGSVSGKGASVRTIATLMIVVEAATTDIATVVYATGARSAT